MPEPLLPEERELILNRLADLDIKIGRQFIHLENRVGELEQFSRRTGFKSGAITTASAGGLVMVLVEVFRQLEHILR